MSDRLERTLNSLKLEKSDLRLDVRELKKERDRLTSEISDLVRTIGIVKEKRLYDFVNMSDLILKISSDVFDVSVDVVTSKTQKREALDVRGCTNLLLKEYTTMSLESIGKVYKGRNGEGINHATILNSLKEYRNTIVQDVMFANKVKLAKVMINEMINK
jgi:chromosomal replication initiation ATPase DnaA